MISEKPLRILHVLGCFNPGGIETWLLHVLRHIDRQQFHMDFIVHDDEPGAYDTEVRALGSCIYPCLHPRRPRQYARHFKSILQNHGPYDIIHSHVHHFSGYVLRLAHQTGIPARIAHSHNDTSPVQRRAGFLRKRYHALMRSWIDRYATVGLAASEKAAASLFGPDWKTDSRWRLLFYGIDLAPFHGEVDATTVRTELGIPPRAFVVGHVGRFEHQKNHPFLVRIFAELARRDPAAHLLLIGDGALRSEIEQSVTRLALSDRVIFAGTRRDVPRIMRGAMDTFLLPSWFEGLPMVLIEAQAAGLPCVISNVIAPETTVVEPLVRRVSLERPPAEWVDEILALPTATAAISRRDARHRLEESRLNIHNSVSQLQTVYGTLARRAGSGNKQRNLAEKVRAVP